MSSPNKTFCDKPRSIVLATLKLLKQDSRDVLTISQDTKVPFHWLRKFKAGKIPKPSANRVQYLYESLSKKQIAL